jgi:hypothetical protein
MAGDEHEARPGPPSAEKQNKNADGPPKVGAGGPPAGTRERKLY